MVVSRRFDWMAASIGRVAFQAIGQSFDWLVPAEAEVLGARVADRPAAFPLAELEQRASASVVDRDVFSRRLRPRERRHQHLMLGEDVQARTL